MKKSRLFAWIPVFFIATASMNFSGCTDCAPVNALCDLVNQSFGSNANSITVGQAINLTAAIFNESSPEECAVTDIALATGNLLDVLFETGGTFASLANSPYAQAALNPDEYFNWADQVTFNQAGQYRLDYYSDYSTLVQERSENNNYLQWLASLRTNNVSPEQLLKDYLKTTNNYRCIYITVLPDANGNTVIEGKPAVEFASQKGKLNVSNVVVK